MPIETITHGGNKYPAFQAQGFAAQFAIPFFKQFCGSGIGYDIGCNRLEWCMPGAIPIDPVIDPAYDAMNLPDKMVDFIFSSHCAEHLPDWVDALDYWQTKIKKGGVLFLYLPAYSQSYWRPWNNRKHIHALQPDVIRDYLIDRGWRNVFVSGTDLNNSFYAVAENA